MPPPDLRNLPELSAFIRDAAEGIGPTLAPEADWAPVAFVVKPDGSLRIVGSEGWTNDEQRDKFLGVVITEIARERAVACGMIAVIWAVTFMGDGSPIELETRPREHPQRAEMLHVLCYSADEKLSATAAIERSTGHPALREWEQWGGPEEGGTTAPLQAALRKVRDG